MYEVECVVDSNSLLGEGPVWDPKESVLWWLDIYGRKIHRFNPADGSNVTWNSPEELGCIGLRANGGLIVTRKTGFYFFDPATGQFEAIIDPEAHLPETRFNDGKTDRQGRFWAGTMFEVPGRETEYIGGLYRMDGDRSVHKMISGVSCANGLAWSPDSRRMYFADTWSRKVWRYDSDPDTGAIDNRQEFIDVAELNGLPDGATVDAEGCYWLTVPLTFQVCRFDPDGQLMRSIQLPTDHPSCCEFGGPNMNDLYVTTARLRRPDEFFRDQRNAGGLFVIHTDVKGIPNTPFVG
jgi:L-arabinonolactonase